jgi:hypothetical protein
MERWWCIILGQIYLGHQIGTGPGVGLLPWVGASGERAGVRNRDLDFNRAGHGRVEQYDQASLAGTRPAGGGKIPNQRYLVDVHHTLWRIYKALGQIDKTLHHEQFTNIKKSC